MGIAQCGAGSAETPSANAFLYPDEKPVAKPLFKAPPSMDLLLTAADAALRTLFATPKATERSPAHEVPDVVLRSVDRQLSGALMRVNHVGEVCAQALYTAQAAVTQGLGGAAGRLFRAQGLRNQARDHIHFDTFDFTDDAAGQRGCRAATQQFHHSRHC